MTNPIRSADRLFATNRTATTEETSEIRARLTPSSRNDATSRSDAPPSEAPRSDVSTRRDSGVESVSPRVDGKGRWDRAEPIDRRHDAQKRKLLVAAAELLAEAGLGALSVEAVTERAQVGRRTFYVHFEGRAQLLLALHSELATPLFASFDEASRNEASSIAVVHRTFEHLFDYILQSPLRAQFVLVDGPLLGERHARITQGFFDALSSMLVVGSLREAPDAAITQHEAQMLVLGARGAALAIAEARRVHEYPALAADFRALLVRVLARPKSA